jgi:hypothetical protein
MQRLLDMKCRPSPSMTTTCLPATEPLHCLVFLYHDARASLLAILNHQYGCLHELFDQTQQRADAWCLQEYEKATGKVSSQSKEAFRSVLVGTRSGLSCPMLHPPSSACIRCLTGKCSLARCAHCAPMLIRLLSLAQANALERRMFYIPSFKIYGSVAGFYDYGPPGCAIKQNVTQVRRAAAADA